MPVVLTEGLDRNRKGWQSVCVLHCPIQPVRFRVSIHCDWLLYHRYFTLWSEADKLVPRVVSYVIIFFPSLYGVLFMQDLLLTYCIHFNVCSFSSKLLSFYFQREKTYIWYVILCFFAHILPKKKAKSLYPCQILNIKLIFKCNLNIWLIIKRKTKNRKFLYEKRIYWYFERKFKLFYRICNNLKEKQR